MLAQSKSYYLKRVYYEQTWQLGGSIRASHYVCLIPDYKNMALHISGKLSRKTS